MAKFSKGHKVVAVKDIGGMMRDSVPKGTRGVVTVSGWGETRVLFTVEGGMFSSSRQAEIRVNDDEIA